MIAITTHILKREMIIEKTIQFPFLRKIALYSTITPLKHEKVKRKISKIASG